MPIPNTKSGRDRLPARPDPYFQTLEKGRSLGYRKSVKGEPGYWSARFRDGQGKQHNQPLGRSTGDDYDDAKRRAEAWFKTMTGGGGLTVITGTVAAACESYAKELEGEGRDPTAKEARQRFKQVVNDDRIGRIRMDALSRDDIVDWRDRLKTFRRKDKTVRRKPSTVNKHLRILKAALNKSIRIGYAGNPVAWETVDAIANAERSRDVFLDAQDRHDLHDASGPELRVFMQALFHTAARPGELARTTRADFDPKGTVTVRTAKGRGGKSRPRSIPLTPAALALFTASAKDKLPGAPLFTGPFGAAWTNMQLSRAMKAAVQTANAARIEANPKAEKLPAGIVPYSIRHAAISEWLSGGMDIGTVAHIAGTSVLMIQKHYFKFIKAPAVDKMAAATW